MKGTGAAVVPPPTIHQPTTQPTNEKVALTVVAEENGLDGQDSGIEPRGPPWHGTMPGSPNVGVAERQ